jgi:signal transduction histidine kinase
MSGEQSETREHLFDWSSLRLLPVRVWAPLLAVLLISIAFAAFGEGSRAGLIALLVITIGLVVMLARLLAVEAELRERTRELSALSTYLQALVEKEKFELAHNLHDELGGLLTAAKMDLSWLQGRVVEQPQIQQRLHQLGNVLDEAMDMKRRVVEDLRPSLLEHFGLPTALRAYFETACKKAGLKCEIELDDNEVVPKDISIALFRVVQEGLTNVIRHANAQNVRLKLTSDARNYVMILADDGQGIDLTNQQFRWSHGLMGMRHRVRALGGRFGLESALKRGTTVRVVVPKRAIG